MGGCLASLRIASPPHACARAQQAGASACTRAERPARLLPALLAQGPGGDQHAFVPFLDLANHDPEAGTFHEVDAPGVCYGLYIRPRRGGGSAGGAGRPAGGAAEFFITYGRRCNARLMEQYGFVLPGNALDRLDFAAVAALPGQPRIRQGRLAAAVEQLLGRPGPQQQAQWCSGGPGAAKGRMHAAAASVAACRGWRSAKEFQAITREGERSSLGALLGSCQEQLRGMPTSIDEDLALLEGLGAGQGQQQGGEQGAGGDSGGRRRAVAALQYRVERKRVLVAAVALIDQVLAQL
jgi:hypothetical protein